MNENNPISLYIHIPWCIKKCEYCDFNSHVSQNILPEKKYIQHVIKDLENDMKWIKNREIQTIFIGGGTPSLFKNKSLKNLIQGIKKRLFIKNTIEMSIEANPHTIESHNFVYYQQYGINRLSLGIQSFKNDLLKKLGRTYNEQEAINTIKIAKKNNSNLNLDLMYGLPEQSLEDALWDLKKAISYHPQHISWYQLSIEPNTVFYTKKILLPNDEIIFQMFIQGDLILKNAGYKKYEISSYSKPNYLCQHNLNYWNFGDYIGIGCGAHGKITQKNGTIIRTIKNKNPHHFLNGEYLDKIYTVPKKEKSFEYFMNVCRLYKSISKKHFQEKTNILEISIKKQINQAIKKGYLINQKNTWDITKKGKLFLNSLLEIFLE